uniref:Uncharacterized protein n=1 Tax=Solanum lycopersicum TaxID=4081 RepID=A0A3Q7G1T0_SOLLC
MLVDIGHVLFGGTMALCESTYSFQRIVDLMSFQPQMIERQLSDTCSKIQEEQMAKQFENRNLQKIRPVLEAQSS